MIKSHIIPPWIMDKIEMLVTYQVYDIHDVAEK